jgi:hypothetical protein
MLSTGLVPSGLSFGLSSGLSFGLSSGLSFGLPSVGHLGCHLVLLFDVVIWGFILCCHLLCYLNCHLGCHLNCHLV